MIRQKLSHHHPQELHGLHQPESALMHSLLIKILHIPAPLCRSHPLPGRWKLICSECRVLGGNRCPGGGEAGGDSHSPPDRRDWRPLTFWRDTGTFREGRREREGSLCMTARGSIGCLAGFLPTRKLMSIMTAKAVTTKALPNSDGMAMLEVKSARTKGRENNTDLALAFQNIMFIRNWLKIVARSSMQDETKKNNRETSAS